MSWQPETAVPDFAMLNLATLLEESAKLRPTQTACVLGDTRLNYAQLNGAANQLAAGLKALGLARGDKVALTCPNVPYFPIAYYAILKAGCTVVPLNVLLKRKEVAYHLADSDAAAYLCFEGNEAVPMGAEGFAAFETVESCKHFVCITANPAAEPPFIGEGSSNGSTYSTMGRLMHGQAPTFDTVQTKAEDTAVILYTSGTTGRPKGAELTQFNMFFNAVDSSRMLRYSEADKGLIVLPLFHSFGQTVMMNAQVYKGATMILLPRFDAAAVLGLMVKEAVTVFCGVPTMYHALLHHPERPDIKLRVCVSGGAALPLTVLRGFEEAFGAPILEGYGLSETSPVACFNQLEFERLAGSIGKPVYGVEMRIGDENDEPVPTGETGEVLIRGYNVMKGYYKRPEANAEVLRNDWLHTGDVGKQDENGYFYIVDRTKDMILRGGYNVYPREIEEMLMDHEAVSMAAVVGVPHASHGEEIKAFVVLKPDANLSEEELIAWSKATMAAYKYPRLVEFRESLPMNATGKILKRELRSQNGIDIVG